MLNRNSVNIIEHSKIRTPDICVIQVAQRDMGLWNGCNLLRPIIGSIKSKFKLTILQRTEFTCVSLQEELSQRRVASQAVVFSCSIFLWLLE